MAYPVGYANRLLEKNRGPRKQGANKLRKNQQAKLKIEYSQSAGLPGFQGLFLRGFQALQAHNFVLDLFETNIILNCIGATKHGYDKAKNSVAIDAGSLDKHEL